MTLHDHCDYWCLGCDRWTCREAYPSPCEHHDICADCAPCEVCRVDKREDDEIRERRESV